MNFENQDEKIKTLKTIVWTNLEKLKSRGSQIKLFTLSFASAGF